MRHGIDFLRDVNAKRHAVVSGRVVVIGGGCDVTPDTLRSAIDYSLAHEQPGADML